MYKRYSPDGSKPDAETDVFRIQPDSIYCYQKNPESVFNTSLRDELQKEM